MNNYTIKTGKLKVEEYQLLRKTTGWDMLDDEVVKKALGKDLFSVCVYDNKKPIGMGRVIGDGAIYFYVQDIIVAPEYKGKGIGKLIMDHVEQYINKTANNNSFVGLMAAADVKEFYYKFGYKERSGSRPGMFKVIKRNILTT